MIFGHKETEEENVKNTDAPEINDNGSTKRAPNPVVPAAVASNEAYFILQRTDSAEQKIYLCDGAVEARVFMETLIGEGAQREQVHLFRASKLSYNLRFQPIVSFDSAG
ncbi:MAG TPA: hypothetical protein VFB90_05700 [Dehalococcoidia bacterium]|nr:hypothetical protein [Dehalococcoidia bacterium]